MSIYKATFVRKEDHATATLYLGVSANIHGEDSVDCARERLTYMGGVLQGEDYELSNIRLASELSALASFHLATLHDDCALYDYNGRIVRTNCLVNQKRNALAAILDARARWGLDENSIELFYKEVDQHGVEWDEWDSLADYERTAQEAAFALTLENIDVPDFLAHFPQEAISELQCCYAERGVAWPVHWPA